MRLLKQLKLRLNKRGGQLVADSWAERHWFEVQNIRAVNKPYAHMHKDVMLQWKENLRQNGHCHANGIET